MSSLPPKEPLPWHWASPGERIHGSPAGLCVLPSSISHFVKAVKCCGGEEMTRLDLISIFVVALALGVSIAAFVLSIIVLLTR